MYQSNRRFNTPTPPPPYQRKHLTFLKTIVHISYLPGTKAVQMSHHRSILGDQILESWDPALERRTVFAQNVSEVSLAHE